MYTHAFLLYFAGVLTLVLLLYDQRRNIVLTLFTVEVYPSGRAIADESVLYWILVAHSIIQGVVVIQTTRIGIAVIDCKEATIGMQSKPGVHYAKHAKVKMYDGPIYVSL